MKLKKELGALDVFSIASGAMISSGIFILPGIIYGLSGPSMVISFFLGGLVAFLGILSVIELTTAMPKAGGDYFFIKSSMGPMVGTISGFLSWLAISLKTSLAIFGIASVTHSFLIPNIPLREGIFILAALYTIFFVALNIFSLGMASKLEVLIVTLLLLIIGIFIIFGVRNINFDNFIPFVRSYTNLPSNGSEYTEGELLSLPGLKLIISTTAMTFVAFGGLLKASTIAEEVKNPGKNIVRGLIASILITTLLYVLMLIITIGHSGDFELATSLTPIADAARSFLGPIGFWLITFASLLAFVSTGNAGIMAASRYPLAMARDNLIPEVFSKINQKTRTPVIAIACTGGFIIISQLLPLVLLAKLASTVILLAYILTNICVIILRESNIKNYQPTFQVMLYPWIQIVTILIFIYFIFNMGTTSIFLCFLFAFGSLLLYIFYGSKNFHGEYALLHLLLRVTKNINVEHHLESELRDIIHERDEVELDNFDALIKSSKFVDIEEKLTLEDLFNVEAKLLSDELMIDEEKLVKLFKKRESEACTAINSFTAIPHIVVDQEDVFKMIVLRTQKGVHFAAGSEYIKAIFLFVSGNNLSKEHLRTIAAIVSIARQDGFEKKWLECENIHNLKDVILLSERKRFS